VYEVVLIAAFCFDTLGSMGVFKTAFVVPKENFEWLITTGDLLVAGGGCFASTAS